MLRPIALAFTVLALAPVSGARNALGFDWLTGSAWSVDTATWIETPLGATGAPHLTGLAVRHEFVAHACSVHRGTNTSQLHTLDPATGPLHSTQSLPVVLPRLCALAWDRARGTLPAVHKAPSLGPEEPDELWGIDPATLSRSSVADDGTVYIGLNDVYRVDPMTGVETWVGHVGPYELTGLDEIPGRGFPGAFCFGDGSGATFRGRTPREAATAFRSATGCVASAPP